MSWVARNGLLFLTGLGLVSPALSQTRDTAAPAAQIVVCVYDYADVPANALTEALKRAEGVFRRARVETAWLDCPTSTLQGPPACGGVQAPTKLTMQIAPRSIAVLYPYPPTVLGFAILPAGGGFGVEACVYFHRAQRLAEARKQSLSAILGHMMVHEVGHLLLDSGGHAVSGIMAEQWESKLAARGGLRFLPRDIKRIRANVVARMQAEEEQRLD